MPLPPKADWPTSPAVARALLAALGHADAPLSFVGPAPWSLVPWLPGEDAIHAAYDAPQLAQDLAAALAAVHQPAPAEAPSNPHRGTPLRARTERLHRNLARIPDLPAAALLARFTQACEAPTWAGPPVWLHGDPHPGNLLIHHGRLSALLD